MRGSDNYQPVPGEEKNLDVDFVNTETKSNESIVRHYIHIVIPVLLGYCRWCRAMIQRPLSCEMFYHKKAKWVKSEILLKYYISLGRIRVLNC